MATTWTDLDTRSRRASQALTETAPSSAAEGVNLAGVSAITVVLYAPNGQTFSGGGSLLGYFWTGSAWVRATNLDYSMADANGLSSIVVPSFPVATPRGQFALIPSGVTVSGGATMTSDYLCTAAPSYARAF